MDPGSSNRPKLSQNDTWKSQRGPPEVLVNYLSKIKEKKDPDVKQQTYTYKIFE